MALADRLSSGNANQEGAQLGLFGPPPEEKPAPAAQNEEIKATFGAKVVALGIEFTDPRPDLDATHHDGMLWAQLLALAHGENVMLCGTLHGFRCQGTKLQKAGSGNGYVIRPIIEAKTGWPGQRQYEMDRDRYLQPHLESVKKLLGQLFEWEAKE